MGIQKFDRIKKILILMSIFFVMSLATVSISAACTSTQCDDNCDDYDDDCDDNCDDCDDSDDDCDDYDDDCDDYDDDCDDCDSWGCDSWGYDSYCSCKDVFNSWLACDFLSIFFGDNWDIWGI